MTWPWTSLGDWTSQKIMCQVFCHDKWATLFSCLISLFCPQARLERQLIIIFCTTACTDNPPFHATSVPVSAPLLPSVCPDLLKPVLAPQFTALWAWWVEINPPTTPTFTYVDNKGKQALCWYWHPITDLWLLSKPSIQQGFSYFNRTRPSI